MAIHSQRPGFLLLDSLVAIALSLIMLSIVAGTIASMKVRMRYRNKNTENKKQSGIETPIVRLDISCRLRGFSDEFTQNLLCVCEKIDGEKSEVYFRERSYKRRIPSS